MANLTTLSGITGAWVIVTVALSWLGQRVVVGFLERRYEVYLQSAKGELESRLRSSEETLKSGLHRSEVVLQRSLESTAQLDVDLRNKRESAYKSLWSLSSPISRFPPNVRVTYADVEHMLVSMREWYFIEHGGLYLSRPAQQAYSDAAAELTRLCQAKGSESVWKDSEDNYYQMHRALSTLRTELTEDLQTRVRNHQAVVGSSTPTRSTISSGDSGADEQAGLG